MKEIRKLIPKSPFLITPHLEKFTLPNEPVPCIYENRSCRRIIYIKNKPVPYKVRITREGKHPLLEAEIYSRNANQALEIIKKIYRTDFDYRPFLEKCRFHRDIYRIAKKWEGLRPTRILSTYEALIDTIFEQNIALKIALKAKARFVKAFGERRIIDNEYYFGFPMQEVISKLDPKEIREKVKIPLNKAKAIIEVAKIAEELPSIEEVEERPDEFIEFITQVKGIGKWTAELTIAKVSKGFKIGPFYDLAVKRGFRKILGIKDEKRIKKIMEEFEEYGDLLLYLIAFES